MPNIILCLTLLAWPPEEIITAILLRDPPSTSSPQEGRSDGSELLNKHRHTGVELVAAERYMVIVDRGFLSNVFFWVDFCIPFLHTNLLQKKTHRHI